MTNATLELTEQETATRRRLLEAGYHDIEQLDALHLGARVRHAGEQFPRAITHGTATVVALLERSPSSWVAAGHGRRDIEIVVRRDKAQPGGGLVGQWADYHAVAISP